METKLLQPNTVGIDEAARLLQAGHPVAIPTETVYGLAANALDPSAVAAVFAAKARPIDNPLIVHIGDINDWAPLVTHIPTIAMKLADAYWPGPLTMILPAAECVPKEVTGGLSTVAVRFPAHPVAQAVILKSGCPLAAPSANRSGSPSPTNAARVWEDMDGRIPAILDGGSCDVGVESTVLDLCHTPPRLLRPGGITPQMLEDVIGPIEIDDAVTHELADGATAASPGMKYKHYAPRAEVHIVRGSAAAYAAYVNAHKADGVFALCFEEDNVSVPSVTYGSRHDALSQAQQLFDALRRLDELGATTVYAACPEAEGVGLAVYNRLLRAAAFRVHPAVGIVGLTGPTGAGKSTVAAVWEDNGIPVINTDTLARQVVEPNSPCLQQLVDRFGADILNPDGSLNRTKLAERAFVNADRQQALNDITHPAIIKLTMSEIDRFSKMGYNVVAVDAPLLYEAHMDTMCDAIVSVIAPYSVRKERIMARDSLTESAANQRMAAQQTDEFYRRDGVIVITNDGDHQSLMQKAQSVADSLKERWC